MASQSPAARLAAALESISEWLGRSSAWLAIIMAIITGGVVIIRYVIGSGSIALQESITYLHATMFILGACYALKHSQHVRVDVFYQHFSPVKKAWIDAIGSIVFLLPLCCFIIFISMNYVENSWHIREGSADAGGIHGVYLLKTLIPILGITLLMQAFAEIINNARTLVEHYGKQA